MVNNNAAAGTSEEVATTGAREVVETRQGYGAAIRRGLREVDTDLVCVCEPDGTFNPERPAQAACRSRRECDFVVGSRTVSNFIWDGANMGWFLQWGNWAVAKLIEVLFNTVLPQRRRLHVPGDLPGARRRHLRRRPRVDGSAFGLEMLLLAVIRRVQDRPGPGELPPAGRESSVTGDFGKTIALGLRDDRHGAAHAAGAAQPIRRVAAIRAPVLLGHFGFRFRLRPLASSLSGRGPLKTRRR